MRHRNQNKTQCSLCGEYDWKEDMIQISPIGYVHQKCEDIKNMREDV